MTSTMGLGDSESQVRIPTSHLTNQLTQSLQEQAAHASTDVHKLKARTAGAQGNQPPKRSHSVELWPGLGCAFPKGWIQSSPAPGPLGSPSSVALQESGALAGIPGWLPLCSFSLHIWGRHFLLPGACGSGFHPDGKSHPGAPKGELTMETPQGVRQTQGQVATGRPYRGQGHSPASWEGRGQRGLQLDILSQAQNNVHTYMQSKEWLSVSMSRYECVHLGVCVYRETLK